MNEMIAKHGRYEMLHRFALVSPNDTLVMEGLIEAGEHEVYHAYWLVPVGDVLWARACLEGLFNMTNHEPVLADLVGRKEY